MKRQKKKIYTAAVATLAIACASSLWMGVNGLLTADAAVKEQPVYSDNFNAQSLSENWTATNANIAADYSSLRVQPTEYAWPGHILCQGYKLDGDCRLVMRVQELPVPNASWFALSFGVPSTVSIFEKASGAVIFTGNSTLLFKEGVNQEKDMAYSPRLVEVATVELDFAKRTDGEYDITYTVKDGDTVIGSTLIEKFPVQDGYFGFNTYGTHFDVLSFDVFEGEEKVYSDDFTTSKMSYDDNAIKGAEWVALSPYKAVSAAIAPVGQLDVSKIGARAIYKDPFEVKSTEVSTLYELSAQFDFSAAQDGVATGFEVGKTTADADGVFVGVCRNGEGYKMVLSVGGKEEEVFLPGAPANGVWDITLAAQYDNSIEIIANDFRTSFELEMSLEGYFGLTTSDTYATAGVGALVDDFSYQRYIYNDSGAADMAINFEGTREFEDEEGKYYQYYLSTKDWYAGSNVRVPNYGFIDNGYLLFGNASVDSSFGPKVKYGDCIVRFDVTFVGGDYYYDNPDTYFDPVTGIGACNGECFGLQFGSKSYQNIYANTQSLGIATYSGKSVYYTTNCVRTSGDDRVYRANMPHTEENEYDLFRKSATYNFMYIIQNGTVSMHFKEASEDESVLGIVREYVTGVETNGYLAVYGANGVDFRLDNFSVTSLDRGYTSSEYKGGQNIETLRADLSKGDDLSAFETSGNSMATNGVVGSHIARLTLGQVNGFTYKHGDLTITFENNGAVITDGTTRKNVTFDKPLLLSGATVEISRIGDKVSVGFANAGAPLSAIDSNTEVESGFKLAGRDKIILSANGAVTLTKVAIFNLDSNVSMEARNFDAALDIMQPWVVRDSIQGKGVDGWIWILVGVAGAVAVATPVTIILIKKKKKGGAIENDKME
ncbi:MAG: hypothetical protein J6S04_07765 [Clostridia bacterium]|nr:hypothetical protein [Clostridia bacterium]